jgi:hypothetical protein
MIGKLAQVVIPDAPSFDEPTSSTSGNARPEIGKAVLDTPQKVQQNSPVQEMQKELLAINSSLAGIKNVSADAKNLFGNILVENHLPSNLSAIGNIGGKNKLDHIDGNWGPNTNAALKAVEDTVAGIIQIATKLKLQIGITEEDFNDLQKLIPLEIREVDDSKKTELATQIIPILNKINKAVSEFIPHLSNASTTHMGFQNGFGLFNQKSNLSQEEAQMKQSLLNTAIYGIALPSQNGQAIPVSFNDIASMQNFKKFLQAHQITMKPDDAVLMLRKDIEQKLAVSKPGY